MEESYVADDTLPPPSYEDLANEDKAGGNENKRLGPATLHVAGRFIHSADPGAAPLYEFSHSIGVLGDNDRSVKVERVDQAVVQQQDGQPPRVQARKRHLFDLKHPTKGEFPAFPYHAESTSRRALCSLGIKPFRPKGGLLARSKGYRVHRAVRGGGPDRRRLEEGRLLFTAAPSRDRAVGYEWSDGEGGLLAREVGTDELMSLVVTAEMDATARDALVAAWMLRVWCELSKGNYRTNKWDDAIKILNTPIRV